MKTLCKIIGIVIVPVILVIVVTKILSYLPPQEIKIAAGPKFSGHDWWAQRYAKELEKQGFSVQLIDSTQNSRDNLARLYSHKQLQTDIAIIQGGVSSVVLYTTGSLSKEGQSLATVASLFYEPLWLFYRADLPVKSLKDLADGRRVDFGVENSDVHTLVNEAIVKSLKISIISASSDSSQQMKKRLLDGEIDAAFFVGSPYNPQIKNLLKSHAVEAYSFDDEDSKRKILNSCNKFLKFINLSENALKEEGIPRRQLTLPAAVAIMAARKDLHSATICALDSAARAVHSETTVLNNDDVIFPNSFSNGELALHENTSQFLPHNSIPLLYRLVIWCVRSHNLFVVIAVLTFLPILYKIIDSYKKIYLLHKYVKLHNIEILLQNSNIEDKDLEKSDEVLTDMENELGLKYENFVIKIYKFLKFGFCFSELYTLKSHIIRVRDEIRKKKQNLSGTN